MIVAEALRRLTDQILYRFTKLQDAMGERLAHEYPDAADLRHAAVLAAIEAAGAMGQAWANWKARLPSLPVASH